MLVNPVLIEFDTNETNSVIPLVSLQLDGWPFGAVPKSENMNYQFNQLFKWTNYLKIAGISQWEIGEIYSENSRTMRDQNIYRSLSNANLSNDPLTAPTFWIIDQWRKQTTTHNLTLDADYTLTVKQNNFGKVIITDTGVVLTGAINIIMSNEEKDFILHNDTAQDLTIKTLAGTGITIPPGDKKWLLCDGTNIILSAEAIEIASTVEAQTGTNNTKAITPLRLHETMIGGVSQSWQDVIGSRAINTIYTNTTGRPIEVAISFTSNVGGANSFLSIDGVDRQRFQHSDNTGSGYHAAIIPNGSTYKLNSVAVTVFSWHELR